MEKKIPETYLLRLDPDQTHFSIEFGRQHIDLREIKFEVMYLTPLMVEHIYATLDYHGKNAQIYKDPVFVQGFSALMTSVLGIDIKATACEEDNTFRLLNNTGRSANEIVTLIRGITGNRLDPVEKQPEEPVISVQPASKVRKGAIPEILRKFQLPQLTGENHGSPRGHRFNVTKALVAPQKDDPDSPKSIDGVGYIQLRLTHDYHTDLLRLCGDPWFVNYVRDDLRHLGLAVDVEWDHESSQHPDVAVLVVKPLMRSSEKNTVRVMKYWSDAAFNESDGEAEDESFTLPG